MYETITRICLWREEDSSIGKEMEEYVSMIVAKQMGKWDSAILRLGFLACSEMGNHSCWFWEEYFLFGIEKNNFLIVKQLSTVFTLTHVLNQFNLFFLLGS